MPLNTNLNVAPFFDDYDANNEYYRILFRPGVAVQARELTQVQSILQNQVESFGNWAFKNGDIVTGCGINDMPALPFLRLSDAQTNAAAFDAKTLVNTYVVSATTNLTARVIYANSGLSANYPNTNVIYLQIINTGNNGANGTGATSFTNNDTLWFFSTPTKTPNSSSANLVINAYSNSTAGQNTVGNAHGISISDGVVFLNGSFVKVLNPTIGVVNNFGIYAGNNVVGFKLVETIVNENQDPSLNDNALGYPNNNAPGAWRMKLIPTLVVIDPTTGTNTSGFNPVATYNYGNLVSKSTTTDINAIVGDAIATRIYEEAGNYVVNPFVVDTVSSISGNSIIANLDVTQVLGRVSPGVGYAQGERVELLKTNYVVLRRGVDTQNYNSQQITFSYGNYFKVNEVAGTFPFNTAQTVNFYDTPQQAVTNRYFSSITTPAGTLIGTAQVRNINFASGSPGANTAQYLLHVFNIKMNTGYNVSQIKSVVYTSDTKGFADVVAGTSLNNPEISEQLYSFGLKGIKNLRNASNNINTQYIYRTANTSTSMATNGQIVVTITSSITGGTDQLPYGVGTLAVTDTNDVMVIATANVDTAALGGTVTTSSSSNTVTGSGTSFLTDFQIGSLIKANSVIRTVQSITNSTSMTVDANFGGAAGSGSYYKSFLAGKIVTIANNIVVTNSTSFSINTAQSPSTSLSVQVFFNTLRTGTSPAGKVINKDRFVQIQISNNAGGPNGPWCLGVSDISKVTAVYGSPNTTFANSTAFTATNITNQFTFDSGQKDTHYDLGYLYPQTGFSSSSYPYLLVQMDYYTTNTSPGVGFYTVESYPVDDANTANTNAVQTKDIPLYVDEQGNKLYLRDYVDFRPMAVDVANNTGALQANVANSVVASTLNPNTQLTFITTGGSLNVPAYGKNFQSDFTVYLGRNDLITLTPNKTIKVIEGRPSASPQNPIYPDNSMALSYVSIPVYPSLSTDQIDATGAINGISRSLIRDTSTAIKTSLVTNRRYSMADIGKLDKRISNLEYYTQLSLLQQQTTNLVVTDQNGLNRFKNGIFAESFNDYTLSDVSNPEYSIAIDKGKGQARPRFVLESFKLIFNSATSTNVQQTGRVITLPYTEASFITQPYATQYRSCALVSQHWNGTLSLIPPYNFNVNDIPLQSYGITIDNATPWQQFANTPFGSNWGAWKSSTSVVSNTVTTGKVNTIDVNIDAGIGYGSAVYALQNAIGTYSSQGYQIGATSINFAGTIIGVGGG